MKTPKKKTFLRRIVLTEKWSDPTKDFGLGPGVVLEEEVTYTDNKGQGFNTQRFLIECIQEEPELLLSYFRVVRVPLEKKRKQKKRSKYKSCDKCAAWCCKGRECGCDCHDDC